MSTKFLQVFTDENPEMQKQVGCMTGIFQMFDPQHILNGRRTNSHHHKRLPSGHALSISSSLGAECGSSSPQIVLEKNQSFNENQRVSMESSMTSFSSSSCSSFSSLECSKSTQQEPLLFDRTIFPDKSSRSSPRLKTPNADGQPPRYELRSDLPNESVQTARRSLDFRDVVKDSINRDSSGLSVKTPPKPEMENHELKHRDSPRPMQLSKSIDGSYVIGIGEKSREPVDLNESLRVLVKLKEAPWNYSEVGESPRTSFAAKPSSIYPESWEAHRFSFDGKEISRQSLDSRENSKLPSKLRELPRLSLDSREGSLRNSNSEPKPNSILKELNRSNRNQKVSTTSNLEQELVSHKRSTNVVAKLMGLEAMPSLTLVTQDPINRSNDCDLPNEQSPKPLKASQDNREDWLYTPKRSIKDPITPRIKDPGFKMKPISNSKVPIETAPWRQEEKHHVPQKAKFMHREAQAKQQPESVYSEIERRLKELEFRQSNKDLRALKQILDDMQEKGLLETKKGEQETTRDNQSLRSAGVQNQKIMPSLPTLPKGNRTSRTFESPIVIMKPANSVKRSGLLPSSVVPLEGLSGIQKLQTHATVDKKKIPTNHRLAKDQIFSTSLKELSDKKTCTRTEDNGSLKVRTRTVQLLLRPQQSLRDNSGDSLKTSGCLSPWLQQKKLEAERSRPPLLSSDSSKPQRPSANKKPLESVSPRGKLRQNPAQLRDSGEQLSESSEMRILSCPGDEISRRLDSNISMSSQVDVKATSADRSADSSVFQQGSRSPSGKAAMKAASVKKTKKLPISLSEKVSSMEFVTAAPEQPSPISVLDASFYQDDLPQYNLKNILNSPKEKNQTSDHSWTPSRLLDTPTNNSCSEINQKKLRSIEDLVQKLSELNSTDDGNSTTDHIASLCETQDPDHRYVSEILLASGLLLKDLSAGPMGPMPIQLHPSGHPINPDLFFVLEQTKTGGLSKFETINAKTLQSKNDLEKLHRKLVFDVVNEVLIQKLELTSSGRHPDYLAQSRKLTMRFPRGQQLLKELCLVIEQLQDETGREGNSDVEIRISDEELLRRSEGWVDFDKELPGVVLEVERLIFKDLIDDIVSGETVSTSQSKSSRRPRQQIVKVMNEITSLHLAPLRKHN